MVKRIAFTGGSGKAGRHVVPYLTGKGYEVMNLDLVPLDVPGVRTLRTDITVGSQVFNALSTHFQHSGLETSHTGTAAGPVDAVVHFAAIPAILVAPDDETYRVNVMGTYNVLEAAMKLGIRKVVIASSETTFGVCFAEGHRDFAYLPLDEEYDVNPMDSYGISKVCNEHTARAFAQRFEADIYALRIGNVIEPHEYDRFPAFVADPPSRYRNAWSYIDARDLGQIVDRCLQRDGLGFQVFNAVNDTATTDLPVAELLSRYAPGIPLKREMGTREAPISNAKIREVLGFEEEHDWRKYVPGKETGK